MKTKIENGFRLTIPLKYREELGIKQDNFVIWNVKDGKLELEFIDDDTIDMHSIIRNQPWDASKKEN